MLQLPFKELHELSISHPELVWDEIAQQVVWNKSYTSVIDDKESSTPNWFVGGEINMSYNCLDKAIEEGYGDDVAVIYESPITNTSEKITYKQLLQSVELLAGVMVDKCGIKKGDRVLFYFPVIPQCLIGMLACTRIGAIYSVVFGGFPLQVISSRIQFIKPKLILTCNVGFRSGEMGKYKENMDLAIEMSEFIPEYCIVYNRPNTQSAKMIGNRDLDWTNEMRVARPQKPIPVESNHPMFIIYTSGTTGEPKGLVMGTGNSVVADKYQMKYMFDIKQRECWWVFSDFVWVTGQTNMSYGPLLMRCSTIIYEGDYISAASSAVIHKLVDDHKVASLLACVTLMRVLRNNCNEFHLRKPYPDLRAVYIGGELSDPSIREWIAETFQCSVYNLWGQTETGGLGTSPGLSFGRDPKSNPVPVLGGKFKVVDSQTGLECSTGTMGKILLKMPSFPSMAISLYEDHNRYLKTYYSRYPGYYETMDSGRLIGDGSLEILSRNDDIIHVSAVRICGGAVEEICLKDTNLMNVVVIPLDDSIYGQVPFGFLVKRNDSTCADEEIIKHAIDLVSENIGQYAMFQQAVIVPDLPVTISHKVSKYSLTAMVNGKEFKVPSTVINSKIYTVIYDILIKNGYKATLPIDL